MITCKVCNNQEFHGVLFCGECGSQVAFASNERVNTLVYPNQNRGLEVDFTQTIPKKLLEDSSFILYSTEREEVIDVPEQNELIREILNFRFHRTLFSMRVARRTFNWQGNRLYGSKDRIGGADRAGISGGAGLFCRRAGV